MSFWGVLGIEPTTDKTAIRHAYAQRTRECHPEEDPERFDALHKAYNAAMQYARRNANAGMGMELQQLDAPAAPAETEPEQAAPERPEQPLPADDWERLEAARRQAKKRAEQARKASRQAEQRAFEEYMSRAGWRGGGTIELGQGQQEAGQQFDFDGVDQAEPETEPTAAPEEQAPAAPLTHEELAWRNTPGVVEPTRPEAQPAKPERAPQTARPGKGERPRRDRRKVAWATVHLLFFYGIVQVMRAGVYDTGLILASLWALVAMCGLRLAKKPAWVGYTLTMVWALLCFVGPGLTEAAVLALADGDILPWPMPDDLILRVFIAPSGLFGTFIALLRAWLAERKKTRKAK